MIFTDNSEDILSFRMNRYELYSNSIGFSCFKVSTMRVFSDEINHSFFR